jgi:hypothetical protein
MKVKVTYFKEGFAITPIGRIYSNGANLSEDIGIQIGKKSSVAKEVVNVPDDLYTKTYKIEKIRSKLKFTKKER